MVILPIYCDVCNKNMVDKNGARVEAVNLIFTIDTTNGIISKEFLQKQLGPYEINREYHICIECWIKSLGIKAKKHGE